MHKQINKDGLAKSPDAAFRCILRHDGVRKSRGTARRAPTTDDLRALPADFLRGRPIIQSFATFCEAVNKEAFEDNDMEVALEALAKCIARWTEKCGQLETAIPGLLVWPLDEPNQPTRGMHEPSICLIAQGSERLILGNETYEISNVF